MKEIINKSLKELIANRYLLALVCLMVLLSIISAMNIGFSINFSERQLISHYSGFGETHFYLSQWYYLFGFVFFVISTAILHTIIAVKLLVLKGSPLAIMFIWFGIGVILLGWVMASRILGLQALL
jgi:hypothetical protein